MSVHVRHQRIDRQQHADGERYDGGADEVDALHQGVRHQAVHPLQGGEGGEDGLDEDKYYGHQDRQQRQGQARQGLALLLLEVLLIGSLQLVRGLGSVRAELGVLLVEPLGVEDDAEHAGDGQGHAHQQHGAYVHAKQTGNTERPRGRRHRMVGDHQAPRQRDPQGQQGALAAFRQRLGHRIEDDEGGIHEDGDADDVARDGQCPLLAALAEPLDEAVGDLFGGAGDLKQTPHHDPEADDDADAAEGGAKALRDDGEGLVDAHAACDPGDAGRRQHGDQGVHPGADHQEYQYEDGDNQADDGGRDVAHDASCMSWVMKLSMMSANVLSAAKPRALARWLSMRPGQLATMRSMAGSAANCTRSRAA